MGGLKQIIFSGFLGGLVFLSSCTHIQKKSNFSDTLVGTVEFKNKVFQLREIKKKVCIRYLDVNKNGKYDSDIDELLKGKVYPCKNPKDPLLEIIITPPKKNYW